MRVAVPSLPQYTFMAWCSVKKKHRDKFYFKVKGKYTLVLNNTPCHKDVSIA